MRYRLGDLQGHATALCNFGHCLTINHEYNKAAMIQEYAYMLFKDVLHDRAGQVGSGTVWQGGHEEKRGEKIVGA